MKLIPASMALKLSRQVLIAKKNSPHIFFAAGVVGTIASTVLACRATLKLSETLDEIHKDVQVLEDLSPVERESEEFKLDTIYIYGKASLKLVRLYAPAAVVGVASIGMLTGSHVQLVKRNTALMAAYAAVQKAYDDYRDRVREQLGAERELDIYHAVETKKILDSDGKEVEVKVANPSKYSPYAKFFDEFSPHWQRDSELNRIYIQVQQNYANHRLNATGHVFLNEVYDSLGINRSTAGAVVGWVKEGDGDGYINFGIFEAMNAAFINGHEQSILLDFNVDGVIYDKI
jgi:hypothetical protein